ncbi:MAG: heparinase II/III family protein [Planctomycetota bacterium]
MSRKSKMTLQWYYRRLKAMGPSEILWRVRRLAWQIWARGNRKRWDKSYRRLRAASTEMMDKVNFYGFSGVSPSDVPQEWIDSGIAAADRLLQHRFNYLALGEISLGDEINWNHEYKRNIDTPLVFGPWMDYRDTESYGDFKYFWEVPRLQHLITLAKAYYLTDDEKYAQEVLGQLGQFVNQTPYLLGVSWTMPMEPAIRLISMSWITVFLKDYLRNHAEARSLIEQMVRSHVHYIVKNYAAYSSANNHLVAEAAGVFIAGICFAHIKGMRKHCQEAFRILSEQVEYQHHPDGVNKEQAIHYQMFAFDFFLLAGLLGRDNGLDFRRQYWQTLEKSAEFIAAVCNEDGHVLHIGDSDDGRAVVLSETSATEAENILSTCAVLFQREDFKRKAGRFTEMSFWLTGEEGKRQFDSINEGTAANCESRRFDQGGYYVLSGGKKSHTKLIFDCGPLGLGSLAAHGHADSLSFILSAYGQLYFIDPGTYTYVASDPFRNYFRSTAAHNTVEVDGQNQSQIAGPFLWNNKARSYLEQWGSDASRDRVVGWHDGYRRLHDPVVHRRSIELDKNSEVVKIDDVLEGESSHQIAVHFHLAPQCRIDRLDQTRWLITSNGKTVELVTDDKLNCKVFSGSEEPIVGWASSTYEQKVPTNTLACEGAFEGRQSFRTLIRMSGSARE